MLFVLVLVLVDELVGTGPALVLVPVLEGHTLLSVGSPAFTGAAKESVGASPEEHCGSSFPPPRPEPPGDLSLRYTDRSAQALTEYTELNSKRAFIASGVRSFILVLVLIQMASGMRKESWGGDG